MSIEIVGHRGARFEAPENTLESFRHAIALGLTTVELDVHTTKDGELVVIHDATVDRTTDGAGAVNKLTLAEIKQLDASSVHCLWPKPVRVPTLAETLETLSDMPNMEIEIKKDSRENLEHVVPAVIEHIRAANRGRGTFITSFDPYAMELAQRLAPEIQRGFIGDFSLEPTWYLAKHFQVSKVGINLRHATSDLVARAKAAGYRAVAWPCNDEDAVRKVKACGFEEVCTDAPSIFAPMFGRNINKLG